MAINMADVTKGIDGIILDSLNNYVRGRAEEIIARHTEQAKKEIEESVRDEVAKTVLQIGAFVSFERLGHEILIKISDLRKA